MPNDEAVSVVIPNAAVRSLETTIATLHGDLRVMTERVTTIQTSIKSLQTSFQEAETRRDESHEKIKESLKTDLKEALEPVVSQMQTLETHKKEIESEVKALHEKLAKQAMENAAQKEQLKVLNRLIWGALATGISAMVTHALKFFMG